MKFSYLSFILVFFATTSLFSQEGATCPDPPPPAGAESCQTACVYCNLDGLQSTNNGTPSGGNIICFQIALHNDNWFGFVAGDDTISIDVHTSNCQNGDGLQVAIFDDCDDLDALVCNPGCGGCGNQTLTLTYTNFIPGRTYWLMVDGFVGDVCDFEIQVTKGSVEAPAPALPGIPVGLETVCPGIFAVYSVQDTFGAGYYHWTAPPGASINGGSNNQNINAPEGAQVTITFGNLGGNVCVQSGNSCHQLTALSCLPIANQAIPPTVKPPLTICFEDLPYIWDEAPFQTLDSPGTYTLNSAPYSSIQGCDSIVQQTIVVQAPINTSLPDVFLCSGDCVQIGGQEFCNPGIYSIILTASNGCDSNLLLTIVGFDSVAQAIGDTITCVQTTGQLLGSASAPVAVFSWTGPNGFQSNEANPIVSDPGVYLLTVTSQVGCVSTASASLIVSTTPPLAAVAGDTIICITYPQLICQTDADNASFQWSGPGGFTSDLAQPEVTVPGLYTVVVTNQSNGCTASTTAEVVSIQYDIPVITDSVIHPIIGQSNGAIFISVVNNGAPLLYAWYLNGNQIANTQDIAGLAAGTYEVVVSDEFGCETKKTFTLQGVSSTYTLNGNAAWLVYPNPSAGRFEISCNVTEHSVTQIKVYNAQGRLEMVQETTRIGRNIALDLTLSPSGVYYVELLENAYSSWLKVVVQR
jgi:Secretion system C-terminal sorting domain/PKD-like domain